MVDVLVTIVSLRLFNEFKKKSSIKAYGAKTQGFPLNPRGRGYSLFQNLRWPAIVECTAQVDTLQSCRSHRQGRVRKFAPRALRMCSVCMLGKMCVREFNIIT
jgi:hypothetical protein